MNTQWRAVYGLILCAVGALISISLTVSVSFLASRTANAPAQPSLLYVLVPMIVFGLLLFVLGIRLFRKRRSELGVGQIMIPNKSLRILVGLLLGVFGALGFIGQIADLIIKSRQIHDRLEMLFSVLLFAFLVHLSLMLLRNNKAAVELLGDDILDQDLDQ